MLSKKTIAFLAALLALLLVANRFADRLLLGGGGGVGQPPTALLPYADAAPCTAVAVSNGTPVRVERTPDGRWRLAGPGGGAPADASAVGLVLDTVSKARVLDRVTARQRAARGLSPDDFGFAPARASFLAERAGAAPVLVEFGADTPDGDGVFARVDGSSDFYAVERVALDVLPASPDALRDRVLFAPPGRAIASLRFRARGHDEIRLEAGPGGAWSITAPYACGAAPSAIGPLLQALATCVAERFVPAREAEVAGLAPDETELFLSVRLEGEARDRDFAFGAPDPAAPTFVYVSSLSDGSCCTVDRTVLDALRMPLDVLREHRILPYGREDLRGLALESAAGVFELVREGDDPGGAWMIRRPSRQPADPIATVAFLDNLLAIRDIAAEAAPTSAPPALSSVRLCLAPFPPQEKQEFILSVEPSPDGATNLVVSSPARSLRQRVDANRAPAAAFDPASLALLRSKAILGLPAGSVAESDPALAGLLADFRARAVATLFASDSASYGLLPPRAERTVRTTLPDRPVVILQLGAALPDGGAYLRVKGADEIFEIGPEEVAALFPAGSADDASAPPKQ